MKAQERETDQGVNAQMEALLARTLTPHPPPESLRRQVRKQVATVWEQRPLTLGQRVQALLRMPAYQKRAWVSVAALAVFAVVAALVLPSGGVPVAGTVVGKAETIAAALAAVALIAIIVVWFLHKHKT